MPYSVRLNASCWAWLSKKMQWKSVTMKMALIRIWSMNNLKIIIIWWRWQWQMMTKWGMIDWASTTGNLNVVVKIWYIFLSRNVNKHSQYGPSPIRDDSTRIPPWVWTHLIPWPSYMFQVPLQLSWVEWACYIC